MATDLLKEYGDWVPLERFGGEQADEQLAFLRAWNLENDRLVRTLSFSHDALATRLQGGRLHVRAQGIAGTLRVADRTLRIVPKCLSLDAPNWERGLLRMLAFAESLQFEVNAPVAVESEPTDIVDHVALAFATTLESALLSGPLLFYQEREIFSRYARGRLLLEPITNLITQPQTLHCLVDEMEFDNPHNRLLCWALETFQQTVRKPAVRARLYGLRSNFVGIFPQRLSPMALDRLQLPLQYEQYEPALSIAKWLARAETLGQLAGDRLGGGLVLDMARVFERFVSACLRAVALRHDTGITAHTVFQRSDLLAEEIGGASPFHTRPDDRLILNGRLALLVDAKYKGRSGDQAAHFLRIDSSDLYQMLASATASGCARALLVYPFTGNTAPEASKHDFRRWRVKNDLGGSELLVTASALDVHELAESGVESVIDTLEDAVAVALYDA